MSNGPLVSIILPTYNGSRYLDQAIQSCLDQTYPHWELIIVDDASTDETPACIANYLSKDDRIRSTRHETNRKLPTALNTGFSLAKGDYFTWTSDDNCYRPGALKTMVAFLESHPKIDVVYTDYSGIDQTGQVIKQVTIWDPEILLQGNAIGPCFLYRRRVHEKVGGYDEDLFLVEDYSFWLKVSICFQLKPLHQDLYLYRLHPDSLTANQQEEIKVAAEVALARNLPHMHWAGGIDRAEAYLRLARQALARQAALLAFSYWLRALRHSPSHFFSAAIEQLARKVLRV
jgi:glycosyltransferase involved in cell wall biosynthesis